MPINPGAPITGLPIPTADAATNKGDILTELGAAKLVGGNAISGPQVFTNTAGTEVLRLGSGSDTGFTLNGCTASGQFSYASGSGCAASGQFSYASGSVCTASGQFSHASGSWSAASGQFSHASGQSANSSHPGARVYSDSTSASMPSIADNEFACRFVGGYRFTGGPMISPVFSGNTREQVFVIAGSGATQTLSLANGTCQRLTLTANCVITMPSPQDGASFTLNIRTGVGSFVPAFTGASWPNGITPIFITTASRSYTIVFTGNGTTWEGALGFIYNV